MHNLFIEGLQGSGKSTLTNQLSKQFPGYRVYREGDLSPVELAWCSYMTKEQYNETLSQYEAFTTQIKENTIQEADRYIVSYTRIFTEQRAFYEAMERYEIYNARVDFPSFHDIIMKRYRQFQGNGNIFECSFFQNSMDSMILFYEKNDEEILEFYREAYSILSEKRFQLLYLDSEQIRSNIEQIRKERVDSNGNELWFPLMIQYLTESPHGKANGYKDINDLVCYLEHRRQLELRCIKEIIKEKAIILPAKKYSEPILL